MRLTQRIVQLEGQRVARGGTGATGRVVFYDPTSGPHSLPDIPGNGVVFLLPTKAPPPDPYAGMDTHEREAKGGKRCD